MLAAERRRYPGQLALVLVAVMLLGFLFTVQLRSNETAQKFLSGQDNVTLGLLATGLGQANFRLLQSRVDLAQQNDRLAADLSSRNAAAPALQQELSHLRILNGSVPVHGPGIVMTIGIKLHDYELQDLTNVIRELGAEALAVNDRRITARTLIVEKDGNLVIDGQAIVQPYTVRAIGEPASLNNRLQDYVTQLKARGPASIDPNADIHITAIAPEPPAQYSQYRE